MTFNLQSGGGNNNNLQPRESGSTQYPPAKDHAAQDGSFSDMRQIGFNKPNRGGGIRLVLRPIITKLDGVTYSQLTGSPILV